MFPKSVEVQMHHTNAGDFWCIVEDIKVPEMEERRGPKENWGITEGKARRILNLTDDSEKPLGEWNTMVIECVDDPGSLDSGGKCLGHDFLQLGEQRTLRLRLHAAREHGRHPYCLRRPGQGQGIAFHLLFAGRMHPPDRSNLVIDEEECGIVRVPTFVGHDDRKLLWM